MIHEIYQMTPRQFLKAINAGVFGENHVELSGGIPFIVSENPPHVLASLNIHLGLLALAAQPRWVVNKEHRLALGKWRPLTDVIVLRGPKATYGTRLARSGDVALLVEVSDTTYAKDSGPKLRRYATFRIPIYWIVQPESPDRRGADRLLWQGEAGGLCALRPLSRGRPYPRADRRSGDGADRRGRSSAVRKPCKLGTRPNSDGTGRLTHGPFGLSSRRRAGYDVRSLILERMESPRPGRIP